MSEAVLLGYRLAPDMLPLTSQVQIACDTAKGCGARLAGVDIPVFEDQEKSLAELKGRVEATLDFIKSLKPEAFDGAEDKTIELKFPNASFTFAGLHYVNHFVLPNFYFHMSIAYAILRHGGVELGKMDFIQGAKS